MLLTTMSMILIIISIFTSHPLILGINLLIQSILFTLMSGVITMNLWYSYIFFLMMISGILILFMYMTSIASNKKLPLNKNLLTFMILSLTMMFILYYKMNTYPNQELYPTVMNFFTPPMSSMMIFLMMYLLITLVASVKIMNIKIGPLRQKF